MTEIVQDHTGYIWMSTDHGIARYDGYEFKMYQNERGDSTSLQSNSIEALHVDHTGTLWLGTSGGISRYVKDCDCFFQYGPDSDTSLSRVIRDITEDKDQNIWVIEQEGSLYKYDREQDRFERHLSDVVADDVLRYLLADSQGRIWIGTGYGNMYNVPGGLILYDPSIGEVKRFLHQPDNPNSLIDNRISSLLEDDLGRILVGTYQNGLHLFNQEKDDFVRLYNDEFNPVGIYPPILEESIWGADPFVQILHQDHSGAYWVGTLGKGINYFDLDANAFSTYTADHTNNNRLPNNIPWVFFEDDQGHLWLGDIGGQGLSKLNLLTPKYQIKSLPKDEPIGSIALSPHKPTEVWMPTVGEGLYSMDLLTGKTKNFKHNPRDKGSIRGDYINKIFADADDNIWIGTGGHLNNEKIANAASSLDRFNPSTETFSHFRIKNNHKNKVTEYCAIYDIAEDHDGYLWIAAGRDGLYRFDKKTEVFENFYLPKPSGLNEYSGVQFIHTNKENTLWIGDYTGNGSLLLWDQEKRLFETYIENLYPTAILNYTDSSFWLATYDKGLLLVNKKDRTYKEYNLQSGLPSLNIQSLLLDNDTTLWVGTSRGLARFDEIGDRFKTESRRNIVFKSEGFRGEKGQLLFGTSKGLLSFFPNEVKGNLHPPQLAISNLLISGENYNRKLNDATELVLSHNQNDISIEYVGMHYSDPKKNKYSYKMEPYDSDWIDASTQRTARYTNLEPGDYTFTVKGCNSNGIWNSEGKSILFQINSAWWTRWWAYIGYFALLGAIIYSIYNFQLSKKLAIEEGKRLKEINQLKNSLYTNITHEFRTPLTVILGMTDTLKEKFNENYFFDFEKSLNLIRRNSEGLLNLVNDMLDLSKLESGNMQLDLEQSDVISFVKYVCESFHSLTEASNIILTVDTDIDALVMDFDANKLSSVISNILSNAIKYLQPIDTTEGGEVKVNIRIKTEDTREFLAIVIRDNGIGISSKELPHIFNRFYQVDNSLTRLGEGTGIGLALTKELAGIMNGSIEVKSELSEGSEFTILLPISINAPINRETLELSKQYQPIPATYIHENGNNLNNAQLPIALVIEDNKDVAQYLITCLENKYQTVHAVNGENGVEIAFAEIPDVIICDVMMPMMNGFEVCKTLKTDERTDHIPIILLTAKATKKDRLRGLSEGADAYLIKPFEKEELFTRLDQLIALRKKLMHKIKKTSYDELVKEKNQNPKTEFVQKVIQIIHLELGNESLGASHLSKKLYLSESQIYRKLKAITGKSTSLFIRSVRLQKAKQRIQETNKSISQISYEVGFNDPSWFARAFKEEFGIAPRDVNN